MGLPLHLRLEFIKLMLETLEHICYCILLGNFSSHRVERCRFACITLGYVCIFLLGLEILVPFRVVVKLKACFTYVPWCIAMVTKLSVLVSVPSSSPAGALTVTSTALTVVSSSVSCTTSLLHFQKKSIIFLVSKIDLTHLSLFFNL